MLKSQSFTMRIKPEIKSALNELAARDGRTAAAWIEQKIRTECEKICIEIKPPTEPSVD